MVLSGGEGWNVTTLSLLPSHHILPCRPLTMASSVAAFITSITIWMSFLKEGCFKKINIFTVNLDAYFYYYNLECFAKSERMLPYVRVQIDFYLKMAVSI